MLTLEHLAENQTLFFKGFIEIIELKKYNNQNFVLVDEVNGKFDIDEEQM